jgi:hypothetical protein
MLSPTNASTNLRSSWNYLRISVRRPDSDDVVIVWPPELTDTIIPVGNRLPAMCPSKSVGGMRLGYLPGYRSCGRVMDPQDGAAD